MRTGVINSTRLWVLKVHCPKSQSCNLDWKSLLTAHTEHLTARRVNKNLPKKAAAQIFIFSLSHFLLKLLSLGKPVGLGVRMTALNYCAMGFTSVRCLCCTSLPFLLFMFPVIYQMHCHATTGQILSIKMCFCDISGTIKIDTFNVVVSGFFVCFKFTLSFGV